MKGMLKTTNASCEKFDFSAEGRPNAVSFSSARTFLRVHYEIKLTANSCIAVPIPETQLEFHRRAR